MTNQTYEDNYVDPVGRKKYYLILAVYYFFILMLVAFIGGAVQVYWNRKIGVVVTMAIVIAGWVGYKYISRAYHSGRLIGPDGKVQSLSHSPVETNQPDVHEDSTLDNAQLSAKDKARRAEIERQRKELKKRRKSK